jgi:hypothetical protein
MKTKLVCITVAGAFAFGCNQPKDAEAQKALSAYTQFVDSIVKVNETWKTETDSFFVETPTDPNDPTKVTIDTIINPPESKTKGIVADKFLGGEIEQSYEPLNASVTAKLDKMDEGMKKEYEKAKAVYESLK